MASKRDLKKAIKRSCGNIAAECFMSQFFDEKPEWDDVIVDAAVLQQEAINRIAVRFDKKVADFDTPAAYRKARRTFFKENVGEITQYISGEVAKIAARMNELKK